MRWQIAQFIFCDQQQTLVSENQVQQLEPMAVELLRYFCQNTDQIISINTLIEHVWLNRVVSDNTVSKLVTKLRKAFDDDAKKPQFVATFPKKGYKFIAPVIPLLASSNGSPVPTLDISTNPSSNISSDAAPESHVRVKTVSPLGKTYVWVTLLTLLLVGVSWIATNKLAAPIHNIVGVKALTREGGHEMLPRVSPDGQYLAYMQRSDAQQTEQKLSLWIKSIVTQEAIEISHTDLNTAWLGPLAWNDAGDKVVYLLTTRDSCAYYVRDFDGLAVKPARLLLECPTGSYGKIAFLHDDNHFIYAAAPGPNDAFSLYEFSQLTGKSQLLPQPPLVLGGNSLFDIHPSDNKILISSPDQQQWEGFYVLDLDSNKLELLFKQDAYTCCGIWDHSGNRVVLMGEHPAYQLLSYDLKGNDPQILYSGSQQLWRPERHSNGQDYLFVAGQVNHNVHLYHFTDAASNVVVSSSVDDRLPVYSAVSQRIAYVSVSSGNEELWLVNVDGSNAKKISHFKDSRHYFDLQWSADGRYLFAMSLNEIHKIEVLTGQYSKLLLPQIELRALSIKDAQTLVFSQFIDNLWQVTFYDLDTDNTQLADPKWKYVRFTAEPADTLWQDQNEVLYVGSIPQLIIDHDIVQQSMLLGRVFNLKKQGDRWLWQYIENGVFKLMQKQADNPATALFNTNSNHFDLSDIGVLYQQTVSDDADIYSTVSKP